MTTSGTKETSSSLVGSTLMFEGDHKIQVLDWSTCRAGRIYAIFHLTVNGSSPRAMRAALVHLYENLLDADVTTFEGSVLSKRDIISFNLKGDLDHVGKRDVTVFVMY